MPSIVNVSPRPSGCHFGPRLTNNLAYPIDMLIFDIQAYTDNDVVFEEMAVALPDIRPTIIQHQEVRASGIACDKVLRLKIHGRDRCRMGGPYARMPFDQGECLKQVVVEDSRLMRMGR